MSLYYDRYASPLGEILLVACDEGLTGLHFVDQKHFPKDASEWMLRADHSVLCAARAQLEEYFAGRRRAFDLPLAARGTPFQRQVWKLLCEIPYGTTTSYGALASKLGQPTASRAVGAANGRNPIGIVVPCHRVVGSAGALTGYAGGLERKQALLALEQGQRGLVL
ncbi:MAG TPA: methylated-DNA--[protein]-cysteine S-methyltransferase [Gammaproteobacteria bacterium]|nr:methylated-DNA--[protein]-cysteine S-methyltransferase [Gammaproteobacteria bacterium]